MADKQKLTTIGGAPVVDNQNSMTAGPRGPLLMQDVWFLEKMAHFDREVIPERRMHAKGSGAFGTFTVTNDITQYTRAKIFAEVGKQTELVGDSTNKFYSASGNQYVNLLVWPGGSKNKVDYIEVGYEESSPVTQNKTNISEFMSEKGIKLGLTHNEVVNILGECYTTVTDSNDVKVIEYKLEPPKDTKSRLMYRVNMPVYVAKYCFSKEKLLLFEFGFEYP